MSDQVADRKAKLERIRTLGVDPYGGRFPGVVRNVDVRRRIDELGMQPGQTSEEHTARVAGRIVLYRDMGRLNFATIRDWTADVQIGLSKSIVQQGWDLIKLLDLGDVVGADGRLGRTKAGEPTVWVTHLHLLSKALRPPPEKWHGLTDVEARYRRRYVDLLANPESQRVFVLRARIIDYIRRVLHERGFIEVETPALQPIYGGAAARPFTTHHNALDMKLYLRISPELYLKRCLVGGLERVYEFSRCFRNEGISPRHNPEFTMLELYQAYGDYHDMMEITEAIVAGAAKEVLGSYRIGPECTAAGQPPAASALIDLAPPWPRRRYADLLGEHAGVDLHDAPAVRRRAGELGVLARLARALRPVAGATGSDSAIDPPPASRDWKSGAPQPESFEVDHAVLVNALFEELVEPHLVQPTFVIDYPAPLCPLTKRHPDDPRLALRFEAYVNRMEVGNAYSELNDPAVQRENMRGQVAGEGDETMRVMDEDFCEALEYGMPPAGGLGIGIDRLCMLLLGRASIRDVLLFPLQRPSRD